jgi:secreted trypsin-like serine protease
MHTTVITRKFIAEKLPHLFQNHILCAGASLGSQGSCKGDSGGPLMYQDDINEKWIQIATVQGGIRNCGDLEYPGLYIRLDDPNVFSFIKSVLSETYNGKLIKVNLSLKNS